MHKIKKCTIVIAGMEALVIIVMIVAIIIKEIVTMENHNIICSSKHYCNDKNYKKNT